MTFQKITAEGIQNIGNAIELMAEAEGLQVSGSTSSIVYRYCESLVGT